MIMFDGQCLRVAIRADGFVELCFDRRGEGINKFDVRTVDELQSATQAIRAAGSARGVLVTSAKDTFIVGADIFEFTALFAKSVEEIEAYIARQNAVFTAFEDLDLPSVVAINGLALGGGLEMALAADARGMSDTAQVGVPEVSLGIFPGFGGTVRLPRVTHAAAAIEWITSGKPQSARTALEAGAVEAVVAPQALLGAAVERLEFLVASDEWRARRRRRHGPFQADSAAFQRAEAAAAARTALHQPAALAAIELLKRAALLSRDEALKLEHHEFAKI